MKCDRNFKIRVCFRCDSYRKASNSVSRVSLRPVIQEIMRGTYAPSPHPVNPELLVSLQMTPILGMSSSHRAAYRSALWKLRNAKDGVNTSFVSRIYHSSSLKIKRAYIDELSTYYGSVPKKLSDPNADAKEINDLVNKTTQGNIEKIVKPEDLVFKKMVLLGAIFFKGIWKTKFIVDNDTTPFLTPNGSIDVHMMSVETGILTRDFDTYQAVALPYKDEEYSLVVLQPKQRTIAAVENLKRSLHKLDISWIYGHLFNKGTDLRMPRFSVKGKYQMANYLRDLGMDETFSEHCNLRGISTHRLISIDDFVMKAVIDVDEKGTTAAAAATISFSAVSFSRQVVIDRPFFAFVYHTQLKAVLFAAFVTDQSISRD